MIDIKVKKDAIGLLASGVSQNKTAKQLPLSIATVNRIANKEGIKEHIEAEQLRIICESTKAVDNIISLNNELPTIDKDDIKRRELCLKYGTKEILSVAGISNQMYNIKLIQNIYNDNKTAIIDPGVFKMVQSHINDLIKPEDSKENIVTVEDSTNGKDD